MTVTLDQGNRRANAEALISRVCEGRTAALEVNVRALVHAFASAIGSVASPVSQVGGTLRFTMTRPDLALRGFGSEFVQGLVVADDSPNWASTESTFWPRVERTTEMPLILACTTMVAEAARRMVEGHYALVLSPEDIAEVITADQPIECLKGLIRCRFKLSQIHPFDHQRPVADALFQGRHGIFGTLQDNPDTNFALVGPSKIGKTSLIRRYLRSAKPNRRKFGCQVYVDLFDRPVNDLALARAIRMAISPGADAFYDQLELFPDFLAKTKSRVNGPVEIVLDETDRHLDLPFMRILIHLAVKGMCRVILVGRWRLMKYAIHTLDDNFNRLEPMVIPPFSLDEALELIERPLKDMGFDIRPCRHDFRHAVNRLGRVPGLIQELGAFTVAESARGSLTEALHRALSRIISVSRIIGLLADLSSAESRAAGLMFALHAAQDSVAEPLWLKARFRARGIDAGVARCIEICDELVIHHLLIHDSGIYRVARWDIVAESQQQRERFLAMLEENLAAARTQLPLR